MSLGLNSPPWRNVPTHILYMSNSIYRQGQRRRNHMRIFWHTRIVSGRKAREAALRVSALL